MKLFNMNHSPFATRVRSVIRKKDLDVEIVQPQEALRSAEFVDHFPMGKIPVLEFYDGSQLPDSWVIMEYLEAMGGGVSLRPVEPIAAAHMQLFARYADTYLGPGALFPLFGLVTQGKAGDGAEEEINALEAELARLERMLTMLPNCSQRALHLGDLALVPHLDFVLMLAPMFGRVDLLDAYPLAAAWYRWALQDPAVAESSKEMSEAVAAFFAK